MNKLFKTIVGAAVGLTMAIGVGVAVSSGRDVTKVDAGTDITISVGGSASEKSGGVTVSLNDNTGAGYTPWRVYSDKKITISTTSGITFDKVVFTIDQGTMNGSFDSGSFSSPTWTSSSGVSSLVYTHKSGASQVRISSIKVTISGDPEPEFEPEHAGTYADPYSPTDALGITDSFSSNQIATSMTYIKGVVSEINEISDDSFGKFNISDGTSEIYCSGVAYCASDKSDSSYVGVGYEVIVIGYLQRYDGTQMMSWDDDNDDGSQCYLISSEAAHVTEFEASVSGDHFAGTKLAESDFTVTASFENGPTSLSIEEGYAWLVDSEDSETLEVGNNTVIVSYLDGEDEITVVGLSPYPTKIENTTAASWTDSQTLAQGSGRWKVTYVNNNVVSNIKIGDEKTTLKIGGSAVDVSSLAIVYDGQTATLEYTDAEHTVSIEFVISVAFELGVESFEDMPDYVLAGETSSTITVNYVSLNGALDAENGYSVISNKTSVLTVGTVTNTYNASNHTGTLTFTVTGVAQGQVSLIASVTRSGRTETKSASLLVRESEPALPEDGTYEKVTNIDDVTTGSYIIAVKVSNTWKALSSITTGKISPTDVTVSNNTTISEENAGTLPLTITRVDNTVAISKSGTYLKLPNSTDFETETTAVYYSITTVSGKGGLFKIYNSTSTVRALTYRAGTVNKFAPYAQSNLNGSEYYAVDLFKYQPGQPGEKTSLDYVNEFVDGFMKLDTISTTNNADTGACRGESGYYLTAKKGWNAMIAEYNDAVQESERDDLVALFRTTFADAYARYMAWADANNDAAPFDLNDDVQTHIRSINNIFNSISDSKTTVSTIIIIASMVGLVALGGYFVIRRRKEQ